MIKHSLLLVLISSLFFVGCQESPKDSTDDDEVNSVVTELVTSTPPTTQTALSFKDKNISSTKFLPVGSLIFFADKENNDSLSVVKDSLDNNYITNTSIIDIFDYSIESLTSLNEEIYFSNIKDNNSLYKLDYIKKSVVKISSESFYKISSSNKDIFFINKKQNSSLSLYNIEKNQIKTITTDKCGKYIINGEFALYENLDDNSSLYSIKIDGTERTKLIDAPVDSFIPFNDNIIYIDRKDNNLYVYNLLLKQSNRVALINGTDLKNYDDKFFYISLDNSNHLYSFEIDEALTTITSTKVTSDMVNEYYPTSKGIFLKKPININRSYFEDYK